MTTGHLCQVRTKYRGTESMCMKPATHFVFFFSDGNSGKYCCIPHIAKAMQAVLVPPASGHTVKLTELTV